MLVTLTWTSTLTSNSTYVLSPEPRKMEQGIPIRNGYDDEELEEDWQTTGRDPSRGLATGKFSNCNDKNTTEKEMRGMCSLFGGCRLKPSPDKCMTFIKT